MNAEKKERVKPNYTDTAQANLDKREENLQASSIIEFWMRHWLYRYLSIFFHTWPQVTEHADHGVVLHIAQDLFSQGSISCGLL